MERKQTPFILKDLDKKLVFLVGPRQVGKTWLAKEIAQSFSHSVYLNYDSREDRSLIEAESWLPNTELLILDELHTMPGWKNYIKGVFDTKPRQLRILVTGSARLDTLRQAGDSLAGRFFQHRLLPFSPAELYPADVAVDLHHFMERGGFPEPFLAESATEARRWRMQYLDGLIRSDILDFEKIHDFKAIQLVLELLRERVGSPVSYSSIARDVAIAPNTVKKYIRTFEALYICFRVVPFSRNIARSLLKEPKIYFFDTGMVRGDDGIRFENLVALCLLKHCYARIDYQGRPAALHYIKTKDGKEIDFCLVEDGRPTNLIEVKLAEAQLSKTLLQLSRRLTVPGMQVVRDLKHERKTDHVVVRRGRDFLRELSL